MCKNCLVQVNYLVQCHLKILLHVFTVCVNSCTCADAYFYVYLEIRGQLARVSFFLFLPCGTQAIWLVSKCILPLTYLTPTASYTYEETGGFKVLNELLKSNYGNCKTNFIMFSLICKPFKYKRHKNSKGTSKVWVWIRWDMCR